MHRQGDEAEASAPPGSRRAMIIEINRMLEVVCRELLTKRVVHDEIQQGIKPLPAFVANLSYLEHQRALRLIEDIDGFQPVSLFP